MDWIGNYWRNYWEYDGAKFEKFVSLNLLSDYNLSASNNINKFDDITIWVLM